MQSLAAADRARLSLWGLTVTPCAAHGALGCRDSACQAALEAPVVHHLDAPSLAISVSQVACGWRHVVALSASGVVHAWGKNDFGQLGNGTEKDSAAPVRVAIAEPVASVAAGSHYSFAITRAKDGMLASLSARRAPAGSRAHVTASAVLPLPRSSPAVGSSSGSDSDSEGPSTPPSRGSEMWSWGRYQCSNHPRPFAETWCNGARGGGVAGKRVRKVACGETHMACVTYEGELYTWGYNEHFQLGWGDSDRTRHGQQKARLVPIPGRLLAADVACGGLHTVVATTTGEVFTCGDGSCGQLGHLESSALVHTLRQVSSLAGRHIDKVAAGRFFSVAIDEWGCVFAWGAGTNGALGNGSSRMGSHVPTLVPVPGSDKRVKLGSTGGGGGGSLGGGLGGGVDPRAPAGGAGARGTTGQDAAADGASDAKAEAGADTEVDTEAEADAEDGEEDAATIVTTSTECWARSDEAVVAVACGDQHCLALTRGGVAFGWGYNAYGNVERGGEAASFEPSAAVPVPIELSRWRGMHATAVAAGGAQSAVVGRPMPLAMQASAVLRRHLTTSNVTPIMITAGMLRGSASGDRLWEACRAFYDSRGGHTRQVMAAELAMHRAASAASPCEDDASTGTGEGRAGRRRGSDAHSTITASPPRVGGHHHRDSDRDS